MEFNNNNNNNNKQQTQLNQNCLQNKSEVSVPKEMYNPRRQFHWLGAYRTNALYSGHIFVRLNDLEDVFT